MPSLIPMPYGSEYSAWMRKYPNGGTQSAWTAAIRFMESKFSSPNKQMVQLLNDIRHDYAAVMGSESTEKEAHVMIERIDAVLAQQNH